MTTKRILYQQNGGELAVIVPDPGYLGRLMAEEGFSEEEALAYIQAKDVPADALNVTVMETAQLPQSRYFRDCWRLDGGECQVNMGLARRRKLDEVRVERNRRLAQTDGPMLRASELGAADPVLAAKRQALRDLPNRLAADGVLETLITPEALESYQPDWP